MDAIAALAAQYGVGLIFLNVLLDQLGLPVPALPTLIVAGALVADGKLFGPTVLSATVVASTLADTVWYIAGWRYGNRVMKTLCRISLSPDSCVRQTEARFGRWGASLLLFAKFIPLVAMIAPPLAGAMHVRRVTFLLFSALGAVFWGAAGIGAGLVFHAQIEYILAGMEEMGRCGLILVALILAGYVLCKDFQRRRFFKTLRMARITVDELQALIEAGANPSIVDVRSRGARGRDPRRIPGAVPVDMADIEEGAFPDLPTDRDIVVYCTCPNEASAARVAKLLMARGFARVRPLLGGFDAWVDAGLAVDQLPAGEMTQDSEPRPCIDNAS